jgi:DNA-binding CsgD family transcriptional regulator
MNRAANRAAMEAAARVFDLGELSPAERRVLELALEGLSVRDMTEALVLSEATVRSHLGRIYGKLGVRGRVELLARVAEAGARAVSPPDAGEVDMGAPPATVHPMQWGPAEQRAEGTSLLPVFVALGTVLLVTLVFPLIAVATIPGLLIAGLVSLRARPGSRQRRAAGWILLAALLAALWIAVASAAFIGVASPVESEFYPTAVPGETAGQ